MSTSHLYILNKKSTTHFAEFINGWGSAPVVWDYLGGKYISDKPSYGMEMSYLKKVWALHKDDRLEVWERIPLFMTFDKAYVPLSRLIDASNACLRFNSEVGVHPDFQNRVNHWGSIGTALSVAAASKPFSPYARGVALSPTSVNDMWGDAPKDWLDDAWSIYDKED